jgi:hypothetical protein
MKTVLTVLLGIIALVILLLCIPLGAEIAVGDGETRVTVRWALLKFPILPARQNDQKKPKKQKKPKQDKPEKPKKPKRAIPSLTKEEIFAIARDALPRCIRPVRKLLKRTTVARFTLSMVVVGQDAAATAIRYGHVSTAVYNAVAVFDRVVTLRIKRIDLVPGFTEETEQLSCSATVRLIPLAAVIAACNLGLIALGSMRRAKQDAPASERKDSNGKQSSDQ